jgi:LPS sulfotransferase NodH
MGDGSWLAGPALSYLICATPRSGSTLHCAALDDTGIAGHPEEHFERLVDEALRKGTTDNGVPGTKIMWAYFRDFVRLARRTTAPDVLPCEVLASVLPNLRRFVWMHGGDTTRQAVSLWKALQTQRWLKDSDEDIGGLSQRSHDHRVSRTLGEM